jgi:hypothetical protein
MPYTREVDGPICGSWHKDAGQKHASSHNANPRAAHGLRRRSQPIDNRKVDSKSVANEGIITVLLQREGRRPILFRWPRSHGREEAFHDNRRCKFINVMILIHGISKFLTILLFLLIITYAYISISELEDLKSQE